jgi:hypothetical protein
MLPDLLMQFNGFFIPTVFYIKNAGQAGLTKRK